VLSADEKFGEAMDILRFTATIRAVKFYPAAIFALVFAVVPALHAQTKHDKKSSHAAAANSATSAGAASAFTLNDGRLARIDDSRVSLAKPGGKYTSAAAGRYSTREGKLLLVGNDGRLKNSTTLPVEVPPQPEVKRTTARSNGQYHQTGSNL
jgi:hypothetical protein